MRDLCCCETGILDGGLMWVLESGGEWLSWIKMSVGDCNDEKNITYIEN